MERELPGKRLSFFHFAKGIKYRFFLNFELLEQVVFCSYLLKPLLKFFHPFH